MTSVARTYGSRSAVDRRVEDILHTKTPREAKPSFIIKPRRQFADEGESAKFKVTLDGYPTPVVSWLFDGNVLQDGDHYKIYSDSRAHYLEVVDVTIQDKGTYTCVIENSLGSTDWTADLDVYEKPKRSRRKYPTFNSEINVNEIKVKEKVRDKDEDKESNKDTSDSEIVCAPEFITPLNDLAVQVGDQAVFECSVRGTSDFTLCWYHGNEEILLTDERIITFDGKTAKLRFPRVKLSDSGEIICEAKNSAGIKRTTAKLSVQGGRFVKQNNSPFVSQPNRPDTKMTSKTSSAGGSLYQKDSSSLNSGLKEDTASPPVFVQKPRGSTVGEGNKVKVTCKVQGHPEPAVTWTLNGDVIQTEGRFTISNAGAIHTLEISHSLATDSGRYTVTAVNAEGTATATFSLVVKPIEEHEIKDFRSVLKSRSAAKAGTSSSSSVVNKLPGRASQYDFRSVLGKPKAKVDPKEKPLFLSRPNDQEVNEGHSVTLECKVKANPEPKVMWMHEKKEIKESKFFQMTYESERARLVIKEAYPEDDGVYTCIATNEMGDAKRSCVVKVKALESCTDEESDHTAYSTEEGMSCDLNPPVENEIETIDDRTQLEENLETSDSAESEKSEKHLAVSENENSELQGKPKNAPVQEKKDDGLIMTKSASKEEAPFIKDFQQEDVPEKKDDGFKMTKTASKKEAPSIKDWQPEFIPEKKDDGVKITETATKNKASFIKDLQSENVPEKKNGSVKITKTATKKEAPFIEDLQPENVNVFHGTPFTLTATFLGYPAPSITWYKNKRELLHGDRVIIGKEDHKTTLTIKDTVPDDTAKYRVVLENDLGKDELGSFVTIEDRPDPPTGKPAATCIIDNAATLSWYGPTFDGRCSVTHYRVEKKKVDEEEWTEVTSTCRSTSYQVTGLDAKSDYVFRISVANKHGFSDPGEVSEVVSTVQQKVAIKPGDISPAPFLSPLSPKAFTTDELPFEPRKVELNAERKFEDFYILQEELGKGKFGSVYKCVQKDTGRTWAAKVIKCRASQKKETLQEIDIMNELHHHKLLMLWDAFDSPRNMTLVMELVTGGELFERIIDDDYILTERECVHFMRQICEGVKYIHSKHILHLDMKPENIMCITKNSNEVKIIDFGLARKFDPRKEFKVMFGTPEFVAPEVVNYDQISYTTDMWSVGVICYILLSGLSPFLGDNDGETFSHVTMAEYDFDDETFDIISDTAKEFIEGLLLMKKEERMSAEECLSHPWLSQDVRYMRAKRLSTEKHKRFMARRKWQKTGNAIRALGRLSAMKAVLGGSRDRNIGSRRSVDYKDGLKMTIEDENPFIGLDKFKPAETHLSKSNEKNAAENQNGGHDSDLMTKNDADGQNERGDVKCDVNENHEISNEKTAVLVTPVSKVTDSNSPVFMKEMADVDVLVGDAARFDVKVTGTPELDVSWFYDGKEINEGRRFSFECEDDGTWSLVIKNCCEDDEGTYECRAKNDAGTTISSAELFVEDPSNL